MPGYQRHPGSSLYFWTSVAAALLLGASVIAHLQDFIGDEAVHAFQINWLLEGRYEIFQYVTMLPAYHAATAALASVLGEGTRETLRLASTLLASLAIPAFLALAHHCRPDEAQSRTLQFIFLPVYFPLFFLIYTDLFALAPVLLMLERSLRRHYRTAGFCALLAVLARQTNVVWVAYVAWLVLLEHGDIRWTREFLVDYVRRAWPLLLTGLLFLAFVLVNGGVAVGDVEQHGVSFNPSNVYFFLFTGFVLFLPYTLAQAGEVLALLRRHYWLLPAALAGYFVFAASFDLSHQYNASSLAFYRHNLVLHAINDIIWLKVASYLAMLWMLLAFALTALDKHSSAALRWLLPFACLSVLPLPLIEPRYYLVALSLFLALRPPIPVTMTAVTLACYLPAASYILYHISRMHFFL